MTSGEKAEPERSAISSTEHKKHCLTHPFGDPHTDGKCCLCGITREELEKPEKPALMCTCGHSLNWHPKTNGHACTGDSCLDCAEFRCDHTRCGWKPRCTCGPDEACSECPEPEEPPLTPEEEEELEPVCKFEEGCHRVDPCDPGCAVGAAEMRAQLAAAGQRQTTKPPPQPDRRPPYLLAYSVQGHLYEVALPGDATAAALDGRLVITHQLGPVAGICQIAPITSEEGR